MGKSRSSDLVNIMVGDMTCDCWCTTQSSLLRENPWGNGRRYGVVIVRVGVCYCTKKRTRLHHFRKEIQKAIHFGRSSREFWRFLCIWVLIVFFITIIKVCRKVPSMVSVFLNICFNDVFIDCFRGWKKE